MSRVKVAILDTGIDSKHDYLKENIIGGRSFILNDKNILIGDEYSDDNGHGSSCASLIKKEFKDIDIFAIKILDSQGRSNVQVLEEALKFILKTDIRLINLSLSINENKFQSDLYSICKELFLNGKIIVSSLANRCKSSYPCVFDNVIGVKGFILENKDSFWYNKNYDIQCVIDNNSYLSCSLNNSYQLFGKSNSQATARLTGKIAKVMSKYPKIELEGLNKELESLALKNRWSESDLLSSKRYYDNKVEPYDSDNYILKSVKETLKEVLKIDDKSEDIYDYNLFSNRVGLNDHNCFNVIRKMEEKFNIKIEYINVSRYDFVSVHTLTKLVELNINE